MEMRLEQEGMKYQDARSNHQKADKNADQDRIFREQKVMLGKREKLVFKAQEDS